MFNLTVESVLKDFKSKVEALNKIADRNNMLADKLKEDAALFIAEANESIAEAARAKRAAKKIEAFLNE